MNSFKIPVRVAFVAVALLVVMPAGVVRADEGDALHRSVAMFEAGEYFAAQELLVSVDRSQLSRADQMRRDEYLNRVQVAITMQEKGVRDLEDAQTALASDDHAAATRLLRGVLANDYVSPQVSSAAETLLDGARGRRNDAARGARVQLVAQTNEPADDVPMTTSDVDRARTLTAEANDAFDAGRYSQAERLFSEALSMVAGFPEAVDGLSRVRDAQINASGTRAESLIDQIRREDRINWQRTVAEYRDVELAINAEVDGERFDRCRQLLIRAGQVIESGKQFADPLSKYDSLRDEYETLSASVEQRARDYNERVVAETRRAVEDERRERLEQDAQDRARQVASLMAQAIQHRKDGDLDAAINILRQVSVIDPRNQSARWLTDELVERRDMRRSRELRDALYAETQRVLQGVEEAKIPWHEELRYPDNWREMIVRPERQGPGVSRNRRLISALDQDTTVQFADATFGDVMEELATANRLPIIVNWHDLKRAGVDADAIIDLRLPGEISLRKALTEVLEQAGGGEVAVGYALSDGVIKVATQDTLDHETYQAVYDISDLLMEIPVFNDAPLMDLRDANRLAQAAATTEAQQRPWLYGDDDDDEREEDPGRRDRVRQIIDLLQENVFPNSWKGRGGSIGTIDEFNGQLVITQNSAGQQKISSLLGKLREQRAVQIAVDARFITVSSHYLEEMGIDLDIVLNSGSAGFDFVPSDGGGALTDPVLGSNLLLPRSFSRLGFVPNTPGLGTAMATPNGVINQPFGQPYLTPGFSGGSGGRGTPIPISGNTLGYTDPANLGSDIPGSFAGTTVGPALSIFGSFLDNIQVDFLIRATQADSRTSVLTAPRLVLFNGQRSWVAVTVQQNFVSTLNPVVATGAVAQAPQTGTIDSGAVLDVNATVTADKRYVTMTLRPGLTRLLDLQTIPFSGGGAGGGFGGGTALAAFIQLPTLSSQRVQTTVSVPDGGTLLIGGQKLASETEVEAGVPVLSKIPLLKRAYSSRTMIKDEQTLLILIKPKIIIQSEQEELAFPSFSGA